jgi:carboxypeptidase C (cathepsin A)
MHPRPHPQVPQGFTFMTIHGAGHEVPAYRPEYALRMIEQFLKGEL